jgi:hypothetical protein
LALYVGTIVDFAVGLTVGILVGIFVGLLVGADEGIAEGSAEGTPVGIAVGTPVGRPVGAPDGLQINVLLVSKVLGIILLLRCGGWHSSRLFCWLGFRWLNSWERSCWLD